MSKPNQKLTSSKWITVRMPRAEVFGGGLVDADLPDTPTNRAIGYPIIREWTQWFDADDRVVA